MPRAVTVYHQLPPALGEVQVEHLTTEEAAARAGALIAASLAGYSAQLEQRASSPLRPGTLFREKYNPSPRSDAYRRFKSDIVRRGERGGYYSVINDPGQKDIVCAFAEILPTEVGREDSLYINSIVTKPLYQRQGLASVCLHAALLESGLSADAPVYFDGFDDSTVLNNRFFGPLGFKRGRMSRDRFEVGAIVLPRHLFRASSLGGVVAGLEARIAGLAHHRT